MTATHPLFSDHRNRAAVDAVVKAAEEPPGPLRRWTLFVAAPTDTGGRPCWMPKGADAHRAAVWRHRILMERARVGVGDRRILRLHIAVVPGPTRRPEADYLPTVSLIRGALPSTEYDVVHEPVVPDQRPGVYLHLWTER